MTDTHTPPASPPHPKPTPDTAGFWQHTERGELALCWCPACARYQHPPVERCRFCAGVTEFRPVSGDGSLYSYIVVHRAIAPGYQHRPGHLIGLVELDDQPGLRLSTQLVDIEPTEVKIGMPLRARIVALPGGPLHVPMFGPCEGQGAQK
jgi:hypothetical protein